MTIHRSHPFEPAREDRDALRRFRGRLASGVTLWTSGSGPAPVGGAWAGLTVSSVMVAAGAPPRVLALLDPDSDVVELLRDTGTATVQVLAWSHRQLADMFAGTAPAPGGAFTHAGFEESAWGPALVDAPARLGVRLESEREVGWSVEVTCVVEHAEVSDADLGDEPLVHHRGRWWRIGTGA